MFDSPFIIPVAAFALIAVIVLSRGPLGRALADRIAGRGRDGRERDADTPRELAALRREVAELAERVDFAERILTGRRGEERLPGGREPAGN